MSKVVEEIVLKVRVDNKQSDKALKGLGNETKAATKKVDQLGRAFKLVAGLAIANQLKNIAASAIEVADSFTRVENALQTVFGSVGAANEQMMFLDETANRLGTDLLATSKGFTMIAAAGKSAGLSTKQIQEIFAGASEASAALSLSAENTNGVLLAFSQILSKGKVQAEELRGQIGERLPGAFSLAAESMGITVQELDKLMQSGDLAADEFLPKFAAQLKKTFHEGAMKNSTKSIANATRVQNEYNKSLKEVGGPLKEVTTGISSFFLDLVGGAADLAAKNQDFLVGLIYGFDEVKKATDKAASGEGDFGAQTIKTEKEVEKLTEAMSAFNAIELKLEAAQELDNLQNQLGLTTKGFELIKKEFGGDTALLDLVDAEGTDLRELKEIVDKIIEAQKSDKGLLQINKSDEDFLKTLEKFGFGTFDPFGGLDPAFAQTLGKVGNFAKADKDKVQPTNLGPTEALEAGSADALRFASRPIEKNMEKIAKDQLSVLQKIDTGINQIGMNQDPVNTADI
jgi:tape measure domain-containing protein